MTIIDAIETANTSAGGLTLVFANMSESEFTRLMDSLSFAECPLNVVAPFDSNGRWTTQGRRKSVVPLQGWVLNRLPQEGIDYRSAAIEDDYIQPMRAKAVAFINALLDTDIIDPEEENFSDSIRPVYAFLNMHFFGVSYSINLPVVENVC